MDMQIRDLSKRRRRRNLLKRACAMLCVLVMIFTMNTLKRSADTLEHIPACGMSEHYHSSSCYEGDQLVCGQYEHTHTDACYQQRPFEEDDLDIVPDVIEETVPELGDLDLSLDLSADDLVQEDTHQPIASNEQQKNEYMFKLGSSARLSEIIAKVELPVAVDNVYGIGFVDEKAVNSVSIEKTDRDYCISTVRAFDVIELVVEANDQLYIIKLTDGYAPMETNEEIVAAETTFEEATEESVDEFVVEGTPEDAEDETTDGEVVIEEPVETEVPVAIVETTEEPVEAEMPAAIVEPTEEPADEPMVTEEPTVEPTEEPVETEMPAAIVEPTEEPADEPTTTEELTAEPTEEVVEAGISASTEEPTEEPAADPTATEEQTAESTEEPVAESVEEMIIDVDEEAFEVEYPATEFEGGTRYVNVSVSAPEGAFPEGTTMAVQDVLEKDTRDSIEEAVTDDFVGVKDIHAVDIAFFNAEGEEIEPLLPISVALSMRDIEEQQSVVVVHVDDEGEASIVSAEKNESEVSFESDAFSIYALVITETIEIRYIDAFGATWNINVGYGQNAGIPAGTKLSVREVPAEDYIDETEAVLENKEIKLARFFDISLIKDGREIQPKSAVTVNVQLTESGEGEAQALHFGSAGVEVLEAREQNDAIVFETTGFSVYGVVYTVDFEYNSYAFSMPGEGVMLLSELLSELHIDEAIENVDDVRFTDESLLRVERLEKDQVVYTHTHWSSAEGGAIAYVDPEDGEFFSPAIFAPAGDWVLRSQASFDSVETLSVMTHGGKLYEIRVTDPETGGQYELNGSTATIAVSVKDSVANTEQSRTASFDLTFTYTVQKALLDRMKGDAGNPTLIYDISSYLATCPLDVNDIRNGHIVNGANVVGSYRVENGKVYLAYTDKTWLNSRETLSGSFTLTAVTKEEKLGVEDTYTYQFPGVSNTLVIHYRDVVTNQSKSLSYNGEIDWNTNTVMLTRDADGKYRLNYEAKIQVLKALDTLTFSDTFDGNQKLDADSIEINGTKVTGLQEGATSFSFNVGSALGKTGSGSIEAGWYTVRYSTILPESELIGVKQNWARWNLNGTRDVDGGKTTVTLRKPVPTPTPSPTPDPTPEGQTPSPTPVETTSPTPAPTTRVEKTANSETGGTWKPGQIVAYRIIAGEDGGDVSYMWLQDYMTDVQKLTTDITITYKDSEGNNQTITLDRTSSPFISAQAKDSDYSAGDIMLFYYQLDGGCYGPVTIEYSAAMISEDEAKAAGVYGKVVVRNKAQGNNGYDGTEGEVTYPTEPPMTVDKTVNDNDGTYTTDETLHYSITFGGSEKKMDNVEIYDEMTDVQKLSSAVTVQLPTALTRDIVLWDGTIVKAGEAQFAMPLADGMWGNNGVVWPYFDDDIYKATEMVRVFKYKLPEGIGMGPIVVEYDVKIIDDDTAKSNNISGTHRVVNKASVNGTGNSTEGNVEFPSVPPHIPTIEKDAAANDDAAKREERRVTWTITIKPQSGSTYPLNKIAVIEDTYNWHFRSYADQGDLIPDMVHATITTKSGRTLCAGEDYGISLAQEDAYGIGSENPYFYFEEITEEAYITLDTVSTKDIIDGFEAYNKAGVHYWIDTYYGYGDYDDAKYTYTNPDLQVTKSGTFDPSTKIIEWEVVFNANKQETQINNLRFLDQLPEGLTLLNYEMNTTEDPTVEINFEDTNLTLVYTVNTATTLCNKDENYCLERDYNGHPVFENGHTQTHVLNYDSASGTIDIHDIIPHSVVSGEPKAAKTLNGQQCTVKYKTRISDEMWNRITSSATGNVVFLNTATFTDDGDKKYTRTARVTVKVDDYLEKQDLTLHKAEGSNETTDDILTYGIAVNPKAYRLNGGRTLTLTDTIPTEMEISTNSVKVYSRWTIDNETHGVSGEELAAARVSYNDDTRQLTIVGIPDETAAYVVLQCKVRALGEQTFSNTATLSGGGSHSSTATTTHKILTHSATASGYVNKLVIYLQKVDENDLNQRLVAEFELRKYTLDADGRIIGEGEPMSTYTTSSSGSIEIGANDDGSDKLEEGVLYALIETKAPDDYKRMNVPHYFVVYPEEKRWDDATNQWVDMSDAEKAEARDRAWALDNRVEEANGITVASMPALTTWNATNIKAGKISVNATKIWSGDSNNLFETRPDYITLNLQRRQSPEAEWETVESVNISPTDAYSRLWPKYTWPDLDDRCEYRVTEDAVDGYMTTVEDDGKGGFTVTNTLIPTSTTISVHKDDAFRTSDAVKPEQILVKLMSINTPRGGTAQAAVPSGFTGVLTAENNWSYTWSDLPASYALTNDEGEITEAGTVTYTVLEDEDDLAYQGFHYAVSYSDNGKGVLSAVGDDALVITNAPTRSFTVLKRFMIHPDEGSTKYTDGYTWVQDYTSEDTDGKIYFKLMRGNEGSGYQVNAKGQPDSSNSAMFTVTYGDTIAAPEDVLNDNQHIVLHKGQTVHWALTIPNLPDDNYYAVECDKDGNIYQIGVDDGYYTCWEFTNTINAICLKNQLVSVRAEKEWADVGADHPDVSFTLYRTVGNIQLDNASEVDRAEWTKLSTLTLNRDGRTSSAHSYPFVLWEDLPRYNFATHERYTYRVVEEQIEGYDSVQTVKTEGGAVFKNTPRNKDLTVFKAWTLDGTRQDTWPEGYSVGYAVARDAYLVRKTTNALGGTVYSKSSVKVESNSSFRTGTLDAQTPSKHEDNMPVYGEWEDDSHSVQDPEMYSTVRDNVYRVLYEYRVVETSVTVPTGGLYEYAANSRSADVTPDGVNWKATLTNDYTRIEAVKTWTGVEEEKLARVTFNLTRDKIYADQSTVRDGDYKQTATLTTEDKTENSLIWKKAWDMLPSGGEDANGAFTYRYSVAEVEFVYDGMTYTVNGNTASDDSWQVTIVGNAFTNRLAKKPFEFGKLWRNPSLTAQEWPEGKTINVTIYRFAGTDTTTKELFATITGLTGAANTTFNSSGETYSLTCEKGEDNRYRFVAMGLPKFDDAEQEYTYLIEETELAGYNTSYTTTGQSYALNGEDIINTEHLSVSLPATGGSGTVACYFGGSLLIFCALAATISRRRRRA